MDISPDPISTGAGTEQQRHDGVYWTLLESLNDEDRDQVTQALAGARQLRSPSAARGV